MRQVLTPPTFGRLILSSAVFCLFWASANGGSAAAQAIAETVTYHKVTGGMPGAPDKYQIKGFGTASNLPNNVIQNVTFQYDFQERLADDGTGNPGHGRCCFQHRTA